MEENEINIISYKDVLEQIKDQENHLLLGNGFNYGLGVKTGYGDIFDKMMEENHGIYKDAKDLVVESEKDLEVFIGNLIADIDSNNDFLKKYVENKVKLDFMEATHKIVKASVKDIYAKKNEGIFLLLNNFSNFFTLNYDFFLYLLLLNFKRSEATENKQMVLSPSIKFIEEDLNTSHNRIYKEIKQIRQGFVSISIDNDLNRTKASIDKVTKTTFTAIIKQYNKSNNKNWPTKVIEKVVKIIMDEEKKNKILSKVDDGAQLSLFDNEMVFDIESQTQNLFFLHGAFHIFRDGTKVKKLPNNQIKLYTIDWKTF